MGFAGKKNPAGSGINLMEICLGKCLSDGLFGFDPVDFPDFSSLEASGADAEGLRGAVDTGANPLQVRIETSRRHIMRVRYIPSNNRFLTTDFTNFSHRNISRI